MGKGNPKNKAGISLSSGYLRPVRKRGEKVVTRPKSLGSNYKAVTGGSAYQNGILNRIVEELKSKFLDGEVHAVSFEELLEVTSQKGISSSIKEWLKTTGLKECSHVKIDTLDEGGNIDDALYIYNPPLNCSSKDTLLSLLKKRDEESLGTFEDDILASVPHAERVLKCLEDEGKIFSILRSDKKKSYFYKGDDYDPQKELPQQYRTLFRNAFIHNYDDVKIEEELHRNNIKSSGNSSIVLKTPTIRRRKTASASLSRIHDNQHVADLKVFDSKTYM